MYLSQLTLNPRDRQVRRDLDDCQQLHRSIMRAFPQAPETEAGAREHFGVLHRLELWPRRNETTVLVQSLVEPNWDELTPSYLAAHARCKQIDADFRHIRDGMTLAFRLRANPTKRVRREPRPGREDKQWNSKRVALTVERDFDSGEVVKDADQVRLEWLVRKGDMGGFEPVTIRSAPDVLDVRIVPEDRIFGSGRSKSFWPVLYEGHLRVTDRERFLATLQVGIGPAKAYGFGLFSIAPARQQ